MKKNILICCFALLVAVCLVAACSGRRPSQDNNKTNDPIEQTGTDETEIADDTDIVIDTVDFDTWLKMSDDLTAILQDIHIKTIADTVMLSENNERLKAMDEHMELTCGPYMDSDNITHSEKVRLYQSMLALSTEWLRINEELKAVGCLHDSKYVMNEEEELKTIELIEVVKMELYKELN